MVLSSLTILIKRRWCAFHKIASGLHPKIGVERSIVSRSSPLGTSRSCCHFSFDLLEEIPAVRRLFHTPNLFQYLKRVRDLRFRTGSRVPAQFVSPRVWRRAERPHKTSGQSISPSSSRERHAHHLSCLICCSAANLPPDCINLGQGYMNFAPPSWVREAAEEALKFVAANHYFHPKGRLRLRGAVKNHYGPDFGRSLNVKTKILITSGANEGRSPFSIQSVSLTWLLPQANTLFSWQFLEHRDEVILFEPFFDQYPPSITFNGGVPVYVPLHLHTAGVDKSTGHDWKIDFDELWFV
jgi:hypothetical protein